MLRKPLFDTTFPIAERREQWGVLNRVVYGVDSIYCVTCGVATNSTCRDCSERCCGNCLMTPRHDATHK